MPVSDDRAATPPDGKIAVDLRQVVYALSDALDLVGIDDVGHGKRVGIMARACGRLLTVPPAEPTTLFDLGMLHDIGVSSTATHNHLLLEFDWEGSQQHCDIGYRLLRDFPPLARLAEPVRYHHTHWEELAAMPDLSPVVAEQANLIYLVDRVDTLAAPHYGSGELLMHTAGIRDKIAARAGRYFEPDLVEAFLTASATEAFWLELEPRGIQSVMQEMLIQAVPYPATIAELKQLAAMFSQIVDAKSTFTAEHSTGVSRLARFFAEGLGVSPAQCDKLEIAGLLHDLGKLRVPDEVLDKPGRLDDRERKLMNAHSYETFQILRQIKGFEEITQWASCHHEEYDASGYPFHLKGQELPLEARILRVADIFQAMAQDRPYRAGLPPDEILAFMRRLISEGRIEAEILRVAEQDMAGAMAAARATAT
jgi:HD-GYP domain-containing protein (c-di-GMP phosphodiesterase class II)